MPETIKASVLIKDARVDTFIKERYAEFESGFGAAIRAGEITFTQLFGCAGELSAPKFPRPGRQEYLKNMMSDILFGQAARKEAHYALYRD